MAAPRKPASLRTGNNQNKEQLDILAEAEKKLQGNTDLLKETPEHLDPLAKVYYRFIIKELEISNILSNLDIPLLEQTSDSLSKMRQCDEILNESGLLLKTVDRYGNEILKEHPIVNTKQKYLNQFKSLSNQLGLSPSSRSLLTDLTIEKQEEDSDPLLAILRGE